MAVGQYLFHGRGPSHRLTHGARAAILERPVRAPLPPRLLLAVLLAELALVVAWRAPAHAGGPRIEDVEESLTDTRASFKVRVEAALILGRLRQTRSVPALIGALRDPFPAVRASAAQS